ncbi:hypothetical protein [Clostridium grantii]|uniref:Uncharacterized protein n=1 Tax=Clostridium grantii DSM 8605 TaxID=1121316 RepID=A0A1M5T8J6_9CLOT|nr:hypothetical protein [Clostridium grantii]SHH47041.1 hypothetical protein SAMN02745207_01255 [Clostridium grantii DSM 8605]
MDTNILFLNGNNSTEFYNNERNKYNGINATSIFKSDSKFSKLIRRLILKYKLPGLSIFYDNWVKNINKYELIIISVNPYSPNIAKYIRKKTNIRIIQWYWNPVITEIKPDKLRGSDCEIYSFDKEDCQKYGLNYIQTYYFSGIELPQNDIINDIYFVGADKGRIHELLELKKVFEQKDIVTKFHITKSSNSKNVKNYTYEYKISYSEVLAEISKSYAILDLVQPGQMGMSQRPMEAIFFSKKLVTNDIKICKYDFYNRNNIFILGKDNIDDLKRFLNSDYISIDKNIIENYDFGNWLNQIKDQMNV